MDKIEAELNELGIEIVYLETDEPGCFLNEVKLLLVSNKLSKDEVIEVVYHELGHFLLHSEKADKYKNPSRRVSMENDANIFMINRITEENDGYVNYASAIEKYHVALGWDTGFKHAKN